MNRRRILTIMLSFAVMLICMTAAVFATNGSSLSASGKLPSPTNLHWRGVSVPWRAEWDPVEDLQTDPPSVKYEVILYYGSSEDDMVRIHTWSDVHDGAVVVKDYFDNKGAGYYKFSVQAVPANGSDAEASDVVESDPMYFSIFTVIIQTLNLSGTPVSDFDGGNVFLQLDGSGTTLTNGESLFLPATAKASLAARAERGFLFKSMRFEPTPADVNISGKTATFKPDRNSIVTVTFEESDAKVPVIIDIVSRNLQP